jgi:hypothetical protein
LRGPRSITMRIDKGRWKLSSKSPKAKPTMQKVWTGAFLVKKPNLTRNMSFALHHLASNQILMHQSETIAIEHRSKMSLQLVQHRSNSKEYVQIFSGRTEKTQGRLIYQMSQLSHIITMQIEGRNTSTRFSIPAHSTPPHSIMSISSHHRDVISFDFQKVKYERM